MSRPVDLAAPPAEDDDLIRVLLSIRRDGRMPPWVNKRNVYADVPDVVTAACQAVPGGDGRSVFYILTSLRSMGGHDLHISRTAGAGYWRIDKTYTIWPTAGEAGPSSSGGAPLGTSSALAFLVRAPGGAETRNGWLMKEHVLHHPRGQPAGFALCKMYRKKMGKRAAAAAAAAALLVAAPSRFLPATLPPPVRRLQMEIPHGHATPPKSTGAASASPATAAPPSGRAPASAATAAPPSGRAPASVATPSPSSGRAPASPATAASGSAPPSSSRWVLMEIEGSTSPPKMGHQVTIKRVLKLLPLDEEEMEEGEIEQTLGERKKKAKVASATASLIVQAEDVLQLKPLVAS